MSNFDIIIRNGNVVLDNEVKVTDIGVKDGIIKAIQNKIDGTAPKEWDAEGQYVFPGMIDAHVHINEPGREDWEGFQTGSNMLAAGGCTTYFDMPLNGIPSTIHTTALYQKAKVGENKSCIDFGLWGGLVPGNEEELLPLAEAGVIGFKAFLSPSGNDDFEAADDQTLINGMWKIAKTGKVLALHAESGPIVDFLQREKEAANLIGPDDYAESRPIIAEVEAVTRALSYAEVTGCPLHFVHISSARAAQVILDAKERGMDVTFETCPHYLLFNHSDLRQLGPSAKCAPPLREEHEQQQLIRLLLDDKIDMITSDHSPSPWELKVNETNNMFKSWGGISGGQFSLLSTIELAVRFHVPLEKVAKWTAKSPAQRFGLYPKKGQIKVGADADLAVVNLTEDFTITKKELLAKHKHSVYENHTFPCRVIATFNRGELVFNHGTEEEKTSLGKWMKVIEESPKHLN